MGQSDSKLAFRKSIFQLQEDSVPDDDFYISLFTVDDYSLLSSNDINSINPKNMDKLIKITCENIIKTNIYLNNSMCLK